MSKFTVYEVDSSFKELTQNRKETGGYLTKFWINHPKLGRSLVKLDEETAPGWSERVVYELAKALSLPTAQYELGIYDNQRNAIVSPDFKDPKLTYINGDTLIRNSVEQYQYNITNSFQALELNEVGLPKDYQPPEGIKDGADLFVGYLILDTLISNNDRHGGNWEIAIDNRGTKTLAPVYDNGASFGVDFGSLVYDNKTPQEYSETIVSMFGLNLTEAFHQATAIKPKAAAIWLSQLEKIDQFELQNLFNQIPQNLISIKAKKFALNLTEQNQRKLLGRDRPIFPAPEELRRKYLAYKAEIALESRSNLGYFGTILQQEKEDIAIVREIISEFDSDQELAADKVNAVLSQSDRILKLKDLNQLSEIEIYEQTVIQKATASPNTRTKEQEL